MEMRKREAKTAQFSHEGKKVRAWQTKTKKKRNCVHNQGLGFEAPSAALLVVNRF